MKTTNFLRAALGLSTITVFVNFLEAQWISGTGGRQYLTNPTEGVRIGTTTTTPPAALTVEGSQMSTPTGEVFRTIGHYASNAEQETNWRLFEYGDWVEPAPSPTHPVSTYGDLVAALEEALPIARVLALHAMVNPARP